MKILITGATGFIGRHLSVELSKRGHGILVISRNAKRAKKILPFVSEVIEGDLNNGVVLGASLDSVDAVIHLAGESVVAGRWSAKAKKNIYDSRVIGTRNLVRSLPAVKVFVAASAVGVYGNRNDESLNETSALGEGFLASVCKEWEAEAHKISLQGTRLVLLRTGVVLSYQGGALAKMLPAFRMGLGGALGSGKQWMSWVHLEDLINMFVWAIEGDVSGIYNAVAPHPVRNIDFSKMLANSLGIWLGPSVPAFLLKIIFGEAAAEVLLSSQKVEPARLKSDGFKFKYEYLQDALNSGEGEQKLPPVGGERPQRQDKS